MYLQSTSPNITIHYIHLPSYTYMATGHDFLYPPIPSFKPTVPSSACGMKRFCGKPCNKFKALFHAALWAPWEIIGVTGGSNSKQIDVHGKIIPKNLWKDASWKWLGCLQCVCVLGFGPIWKGMYIRAYTEVNHMFRCYKDDIRTCPSSCLLFAYLYSICWWEKFQMPRVVLPSFEEETCYHQCYRVIICFNLVSLLVF